MSKKRHLIFLLGFKRVGKNTVADILNEISFNQFHSIGFADALKKEYWAQLGMEWDKENEDDDLKEQHRPKIIQYGEGKKQEKGMHYWLERALDDVLFDQDDKKSIIVTDCRRVEEVLWMKDFMQKRHPKYVSLYDKIEPHMFAVHMPDADLKDKDYLTHLAVRIASEEQWLINRFIKNYGTLKDLRVSLEELYACRLK
jgi:phosphomevalonate kinase